MERNAKKGSYLLTARIICSKVFFVIERFSYFFHLPRTQKIQGHLFTIKDEKIRRLFDKGFFPLTQIKWKQMQQLLSLMSNDSFEMEKLNIRKITLYENSGKAK